MRGALELARAIAAGELSAAEAAQASLDRIAERNPELNAVTRTLEPYDPPPGPLHGVPFSVKENIDVAGTVTSMGMRGGTPATQDAPHIAHLRAAGAVPIARGNLPDLALRWHTDNARHGATINPHDASLSPGGSSGGDAVALASGMVAVRGRQRLRRIAARARGAGRRVLAAPDARPPRAGVRGPADDDPPADGHRRAAHDAAPKTWGRCST